MQSRRDSLIESCLNVGSGFLVALVVWKLVVVPVWEFEVTMADNLAVTGLFTVVSVIRGYVWRRIFNMVNFDNDASILAATTQEPVKGGFRLVLPGAHVDGEPITSMAAGLNADTATQWCNYVRRVMNERQESKSNPKSGGTSVPESSGTQEAASPGKSGTPGSDDDEPVPQTEEALVEGFEQRVDILQRRLDGIVEKAEELQRQKLRTVSSLNRAKRTLENIRAALAESENEEEKFGGDE